MARWPEIDAYLHALDVRIGPPRVSQTTGGGHVTNSYHYLGTARDYGDLDSDVRAVWDALLPFAKGPRAPLAELISPWGWWSNGQTITPTTPRQQAVAAEHRDHVHAALRPDAPTPWHPEVDDMTPEDRAQLARIEAAVTSMHSGNYGENTKAEPGNLSWLDDHVRKIVAAELDARGLTVKGH